MLTKRADNILNCLPADWGKGWNHVWMGTTVERIDWAWRADELRKVPAAVRFISYEPALGPLDTINFRGIDWVIYGGESAGKEKIRPDKDEWAEAMRAKCQAEGVVFFYKQDSASPNQHKETLNGKKYHAWPKSKMPLVMV